MSKLSSITPPAWIFIGTLLLIIFTGGAFGSKTSAFVPLSLIILGFVLYRVWVRQGDPESMSFDRKDAALEPATAVAPRTPKPPPAAPAAKKSAAPPKPKAKKAAAPASAPASASAGDLKSAQEKLCLAVLADGEKTRDEITDMLGKLTGSTDPEHWKGGPLNDLEVMAKALAMAALIGPEGSKYRSGLTSKGAQISDDLEELGAKTKKELHEACVGVLTQDIKTIVAAGKYPASLSSDVASAVADAALSPDGLDGISRCSKAGLVHLAAFLGQS
ncbi:MAG: hypothetical protein AAFY29_00110 [Pseudomonadota bacterium]